MFNFIFFNYLLNFIKNVIDYSLHVSYEIFFSIFFFKFRGALISFNSTDIVLNFINLKFNYFLLGLLMFCCCVSFYLICSRLYNNKPMVSKSVLLHRFKLNFFYTLFLSLDLTDNIINIIKSGKLRFFLTTRGGLRKNEVIFDVEGGTSKVIKLDASEIDLITNVVDLLTSNVKKVANGLDKDLTEAKQVIAHVDSQLYNLKKQLNLLQSQVETKTNSGLALSKKLNQIDDSIYDTSKELQDSEKLILIIKSKLDDITLKLGDAELVISDLKSNIEKKDITSDSAIIKALTPEDSSIKIILESSTDTNTSIVKNNNNTKQLDDLKTFDKPDIPFDDRVIAGREAVTLNDAGNIFGQHAFKEGDPFFDNPVLSYFYEMAGLYPDVIQMTRQFYYSPPSSFYDTHLVLTVLCGVGVAGYYSNIAFLSYKNAIVAC